MSSKAALLFVVLTVVFATGDGTEDFEPTNYDISRNNKLGGGGQYGQYPNYGGNYPTQYPGNPGNLYTGGAANYPGQYPGSNYPGQYPGSNYPGSNYPGGNYPGGNYPGGHNPGVAGPPGAHPGCPLCDSSVYSYCSVKQVHDACCCDNPTQLPYNCRNKRCNFLYANSCEEYQLITNCCCVDVQKNSIAAPVVPVLPVVG